MFFWMKWLTGQVRCQVTGKYPTRRTLDDARRGLNTARLSQAWRPEIAASHATEPQRIVRRNVTATTILAQRGPIKNLY